MRKTILMENGDLKEKDLNFWISQLEKYDRSKTVTECLLAGTDDQTANIIANRIDQTITKDMRMSEIRPLILSLLHRFDPAAATHFRTNETYVRTSDEKFLCFDNNKIARSIVKETGVNEQIAMQIAEDVENFIKRLNLSYISSPMIREIVCVKLLEHGLEEARKRYSRLGIPTYDVEQMINKGISTDIKRENANLQHTPETINWIISGEALEQYSLLRLIPGHLADPHLSGDYHIHILSNLATRPNCMQHYPPLFFKYGLKADGTGRHTSVAGPPKHIGVAIQHCAKVMLAAQSVTYDEPLVFKEDETIKIEPIGQFVDNVIDERINLKKCECLSFDADGKVEWSKISNISKHIPNTLIHKIKTKAGREIKTTGYHSLFSLKEGKISPVIVDELHEGDTILLPKYLPLQGDLKELDLIDFFKNDAENYSITNVKQILKRINSKLTYREIAKLLGVSRKKALSFAEKNSMPLSKFSIIKNYSEKDDNLKIKCRVGGSTAKLNSKISLDNAFVRLLGYIIADGHISNKKYRRYISIFPFDDLLADEIIDCCNVLNIKAIYHKKRGEVTICNFIFLRLILELVKGEKSRTKQIPNLVFSLPLKEKMNFLSAYINSDGCVMKDRSCMEITSVNKDIINSLSYLCLAVGIPTTIKLCERDILLKGRFYEKHKIYKLTLKALNPNKEIYSQLLLSGEKQERLAEKLQSYSKNENLLARTALILRNEQLGNLVSDEIVSIETVEPDCFVYDLEVPGKQNFICGFGGVCAHNTQMAGGQSIESFNVWLAPFLKNLDNKEIKQAAQEFIYELNQSYVARGGQVVFSNINFEFGIPKWLREVPAVGPGGEIKGVYGDYAEEANSFLREYVKVKIKGDHVGKQHMFPNDAFKIREDTFQKYKEELDLVHEFIAKYGTPYIANGIPEWQTENFNYMGCRTRLDSKFAGPWGTIRTGNDLYITLNLPRIAYESHGNDDRFFEILQDRLEKMAEILIIKHKISDDILHKQRLLPFLSQKFDGEEYYNLMNTTKTFGYAGLTEATKIHCDYHLHENETAQQFGLKIIGKMREYANEMAKKTGLRFSVIASPAETCAARLAKIDISKFGDKAVFSGTKESPYYTNSHMVKMDAQVNFSDKVKIEEPYHPLTNGGHIMHVWLGENSPSPEALFDITKKICTKTNIGFFAYTRDYSTCNDCNQFSYGLINQCTNCGKEDLSRYSRITGYYQKVEGWNPSKKQELKDRYRFSNSTINT